MSIANKIICDLLNLKIFKNVILAFNLTYFLKVKTYLISIKLFIVNRNSE